MRIDAIEVGIDPPQDVNVIVEVPIGGEAKRCIRQAIERAR